MPLQKNLSTSLGSEPCFWICYMNWSVIVILYGKDWNLRVQWFWVQIPAPPVTCYPGECIQYNSCKSQLCPLENRENKSFKITWIYINSHVYNPCSAKLQAIFPSLSLRGPICTEWELSFGNCSQTSPSLWSSGYNSPSAIQVWGLQLLQIYSFCAVLGQTIYLEEPMWFGIQSMIGKMLANSVQIVIRFQWKTPPVFPVENNGTNDAGFLNALEEMAASCCLF